MLFSIKRSFSLLLLSSAFAAFAQDPPPGVEGWRVHVAFRTNNDLVEAGDKVVVASRSAMFFYHKETGEVNIVSKVNGLSDAQATQVEYHPATGAVIACYDNTNIDIIDNGIVYNVPEILNQVIIGKKTINDICIYNDVAYLACSFGIGVLDLNKKRLTDSYSNLGPSGATLEFNDVAVFDGYLYGSTAAGVYRASLLNQNLSDFNNWQLFRAAGAGNHVETFNNKLYAVLDSSIYTYDGSAWSPTPFAGMAPKHINDIRVASGTLVVSAIDELVFEDAQGNITHQTQPIPTTAIKVSTGDVYCLVPEQGLLRFHSSGVIDYITPSGPSSIAAQRMTFANNKLWVAAGQVDGFGGNGWAPRSNNDKFYSFSDNSWKSFKESTDPRIVNARDFIDVAVDPETGKVYLASFGNGLYELQNDVITKVYDSSNSSLQTFNAPNYHPLFVSGVAFDQNNNMWVSNFGAVKPISVRTPSGNWYSFGFPSSVDNRLGYITCDDYNNKWTFNTKGGGLLVFNDNGTPDNTNDDRFKLLTKDKQNGNLASTSVLSVAVEQKGEVWVGTDKGLSIFSNPDLIFTANADFDSKQIVIKTGTIFSNFLGEIPVYCIRVDAANRKWLGTSNGVWLVSPDGYTVVKNFNTDNSPLLSNTIIDIGIDGKTGEVFFATEKGIVSYMGTATDAGLTHGDVLVYPNPVRHEYTGTIAIKGLANNVNVKITDIAGNLVYETKSNGGMATWNGLNFRGKRAATGVYLIFSSNSDGTETHVAKLLFIN